ncbi:MAG TPA: DUF1571 domain-containing protein, partial [bacterium]|nr:DUF1571 domain-containing protein [bacterium]
SCWGMTGGSAAIPQPRSYDALKILMSMKESYGSLESYTAVLEKGEPSSGGNGQPQKIYVKFKKPFKVYMKWIEKAHAGREVLYVKGENDDHFFAKPDGMMGAFLKTVKLPSDYRSDGSRYTVRDVGIGKLVEGVLEAALKAKGEKGLRLVCRGVVVRNGREAYEIERFSPTGDRYRNKRTVLCVDKQTNLPLEAYVYDAEGKLAEYYTYRIIKLNPKMKDNEFTLDNREYGFREV